MKSLVVFIIFLKIFVVSTLCPDRIWRCPVWGTCCENKDASYGCCPYKNADCCADFIHCCPQGTHCNVTSGSCDNDPKISLMSFSWMVPHYDHKVVSTVFKSPAKIEKQEMKDKPVIKDDLVAPVKENPCPDGQFCDESSTCCQMVDDTFECCPYSDADCCEDKVHCCPYGYKCDVQNKRCLKKGVSNISKKDGPKEFLMFNMQRGEFKLPEAREHPCPDGESCDDSSTCCQMKNGAFTCCPYSNANCCKDKEHCCPSGYKCDLKNKRCVKGEVTLPFEKDNSIIFPIFNIEKDKFQLPEAREHPCPDGESCDESSTCCQMKNGTFGCCPYSNANCCKDKEHCCPSGYKCDLKNKRCVKGEVALSSEKDNSIIFPIFNIEKDKFRLPEAREHPCPDGESCDDSSTCCQMKNGAFGCCSYSNANCCKDKEHCCPSGYKCDLKNKRCVKGEVALAFEKDNSIIFPIFNIEKDKFQHPLSWSLCHPFDQCSLSGRVCCGSEGSKICCPQGTVCDEDNKRCVKAVKNKFSPSSDKLSTLKDKPVRKEIIGIVCPDKTESCGSGETCCITKSGKYGCCHLPSATCCPDKLTCCPNGYICVVGGCERKPSFQLWEKPIFLKQVPLK